MMLPLWQWEAPGNTAQAEQWKRAGFGQSKRFTAGVWRCKIKTRAQETSGTQQGCGDATDPAVEPEKRYTLKGYGRGSKQVVSWQFNNFAAIVQSAVRHHEYFSLTLPPVYNPWSALSHKAAATHSFGCASTLWDPEPSQPFCPQLLDQSRGARGLHNFGLISERHSGNAPC